MKKETDQRTYKRWAIFYHDGTPPSNILYDSREEAREVMKDTLCFHKKRCTARRVRIEVVGRS